MLIRLTTTAQPPLLVYPTPSLLPVDALPYSSCHPADDAYSFPLSIMLHRPFIKANIHERTFVNPFCRQPCFILRTGWVQLQNRSLMVKMVAALVDMLTFPKDHRGARKTVGVAADMDFCEDNPQQMCVDEPTIETHHIPRP